MRWLLLLQYALMWAEIAFSVAVAKEVETMGPFPSSLEALQALTLDQTTEWLDAIGWTTEFIASFIYCMMSVLGVLSSKCDCKIQFSNKSYYIA